MIYQAIERPTASAERKQTMTPSTFTGNSRPRRQVNLSGRTNNPFALVGNRSSPSPAQNAVAHAHQERIQRQRERERPPAAITIQRVWRGQRERSSIRSQWREEWDNVESSAADQDPYETPTLCLNQLRLLVQFASPSSHSDIARLFRFTSRFMKTPSVGLSRSRPGSEAWMTPLALVARLTTKTFEFGAQNHDTFPFDRLLSYVFSVPIIPFVLFSVVSIHRRETASVSSGEHPFHDLKGEMIRNFYFCPIFPVFF